MILEIKRKHTRGAERRCPKRCPVHNALQEMFPDHAVSAGCQEASVLHPISGQSRIFLYSAILEKVVKNYDHEDRAFKIGRYRLTELTF